MLKSSLEERTKLKCTYSSIKVIHRIIVEKYSSCSHGHWYHDRPEDMFGTGTVFLSNVLPSMKTGLATKSAEIIQRRTKAKGFASPFEPSGAALAATSTFTFTTGPNTRSCWDCWGGHAVASCACCAGQQAVIAETDALRGVILGLHLCVIH